MREQSILPPELHENILDNLDLYSVIKYCHQNAEVANICKQNQNKLAIRFASEVKFVENKDLIKKYVSDGIDKNAFTAVDVISAVKRLIRLYNYITLQNKTAVMYGVYDNILLAINKMTPGETKVYFKILEQYFMHQLESPKFHRLNINTEI